MLLVIADTSPIRYLVQLGHIDLLHSLFQVVSIPTEVARELGDPSAPPAVQAWIKQTNFRHRKEIIERLLAQRRD